MFRRRPRPATPHRVFVQEPAEAIRRIVLGGRCPPSSRIYQQHMACIDAALLTHPDHPALTRLAAAVLTEHANGDHTGC